MPIKPSKSIKYLGIHIDSETNWNTQIHFIQSKVKPYIHILNRLRHILNRRDLLTIYNTIIEPTIHYCDTVWGYCSKANINKMNSLKRRCSRAITGNYDWNIQGDTLMQSLKIPTFQSKRNFNTACLTYKALNNGTAPYLSHKFTHVDHNHNTRHNAANNLKTPLPKHEFAKQTLQYTGTKCWNNLDHIIRDAPSYQMFKSTYKAMNPLDTNTWITMNYNQITNWHVGPDIILPIFNHSYINPRSPKPYLPYSLWPLSYYPVFLSKQTTTIPAIKIVCSYFKVPFLVVLLNSFYQSTFDWSNFINKQGPNEKQLQLIGLPCINILQ